MTSTNYEQLLHEIHDALEEDSAAIDTSSTSQTAQTMLAKAPVILQQRGEITRVFVRPSFAEYLWSGSSPPRASDARCGKLPSMIGVERLAAPDKGPQFIPNNLLIF